MKKVVLINHSDSRGGASVVTYRLMKALSCLGVDARLLVVHKSTDNLRVDELRPKWRHDMAFLAECAQIYTHNGFNKQDIFKVSTAKYGMDIHNHPWVKEADAIILGWINQGMMSLREISSLHKMGKPIAWTLHDMWPITGICHHAGTCTKYTDGCGNCPFIRGGKTTKDLSYNAFRLKELLYRDVPIKFVAISGWIADKCSQSRLTAAADVTVIPNPFPVEKYAVAPVMSRRELHLPAQKNLIVMGAARLDDPIKNLPLAVETLNRVANASDTAAVFFGSLRNPHALDNLKMPYVHLGTVAKPEHIAQIFSHAAVVLSTSHYETLPGTLIEGMAAGATPVTTGNGGQRDIIDNGEDGYISTHDDADELSLLIERALEKPFDRLVQHAAVERRFAARRVANAYIQLLNLI